MPYGINVSHEQLFFYASRYPYPYQSNSGGRCASDNLKKRSHSVLLEPLPKPSLLLPCADLDLISTMTHATVTDCTREPSTFSHRNYRNRITYYKCSGALLLPVLVRTTSCMALTGKCSLQVASRRGGTSDRLDCSAAAAECAFQDAARDIIEPPRPPIAHHD